jgi:hypothetical protein
VIGDLLEQLPPFHQDRLVHEPFIPSCLTASIPYYYRNAWIQGLHEVIFIEVVAF